MEKWTIASRRPPTPSDGPFFGADLNLFMHGTGWAGVQPKTTKSFDQAAKQNAVLEDELNRLCQTFPAQDLSALAEALQASAKGTLKRGARERSLDSGIIVRIKGMLHAGKKPGDVARAIAPEIPSLSPEGQLKRARREVSKWVGQKPGFQVSYDIALGQWAAYEAERQLQQQVEAGTITEAEAVERIPGQISEIKSRVSLG